MSQSLFFQIPLTTSLMPYTRSAIPNNGDTNIIIDKAIANAPARTLNALEPLLGVLFLPFFSLWFFSPLKPAIMLAILLSNKSNATNNTTNAAEARGYAIIILQRTKTVI